MAICKMCHKTVPEGFEFCEECELKRKNQADESYLDSLLNSVSINPREKLSDRPGFKKPEPDLSALIPEDIPDPFAVSEDDVKVVTAVEHSFDEASPVPEEKAPETDEDEMLSSLLSEYDMLGDQTDRGTQEESEMLAPDDISDIFADIANTEEDVSDNIDIGDMNIDAAGEEELDLSASDIPDMDITNEDDAVSDNDMAVSDEIPTDPDIPDIDDITADTDIADEDDILADADITAMGEDTVDADIADADDILADADIVATDDDIVPVIDDSLFEEIGISDMDIADISETDAAEATESTDAAAPADETVSTDIPEDLLTDITDASEIPDISLGVDDLFTDAGSIESDISDAGIDEADITQIMDDIESGEFEKEINKLIPEGDANTDDKPKSWFVRLFGNIVENLTPEQWAEREAKEAEAAQQKAEALERKKQRQAESKEERAKRREEAKQAKAEKAKVDAETRKQQKAEAREKARQKRELLLAEAEAHHDEGRINRLGASILVVLLGVITICVISGASIFPYLLSISRAQKDFDVQKYNEAYQEVYGLSIHDADIELYDRIMTVMYVNTQFNSYESYKKLNEDEMALNALLKGLQRYDKYKQLAQILDIKSDLLYVRNMILVELAEEYDLTEEEAYNLIDIEDSVDYSECIYELLGTYALNE